MKLQLDDNIFILSIHNPSCQIWLSSPISGAHHFKLTTENDFKSWTSTRDKKINFALKNNFGFGGTNGSLIFKKIGVNL